MRSLPKETPFWTAFGLWFTFEPVLMRSTIETPWRRLGSSLDDPTFVFIARRRAPSFDWHVAPDDQDLLDGVGTWGTDRRKGDDTFESLLFMTLDNEETRHRDSGEHTMILTEYDLSPKSNISPFQYHSHDVEQTVDFHSPTIQLHCYSSPVLV